MRNAADQGNAMAQAGFAAMLERGIGVRKSFTEAARWYTRAAEQGLAVGQLNLGLLLNTNLTGEKDPVGAYKWMAIAAFNGNEAAHKFLKDFSKEMSDEQIAIARSSAQAFVPKPVIDDVPPAGGPQS